MEIVKDIFTNSNGSFEMWFSEDGKKDGLITKYCFTTTRANMIKMAEEFSEREKFKQTQRYKDYLKSLG